MSSATRKQFNGRQPTVFKTVIPIHMSKFIQLNISHPYKSRMKCTFTHFYFFRMTTTVQTGANDLPTDQTPTVQQEEVPMEIDEQETNTSQLLQSALPHTTIRKLNHRANSKHVSMSSNEYVRYVLHDYLHTILLKAISQIQPNSNTLKVEHVENAVNDEMNNRPNVSDFFSDVD